MHKPNNKRLLNYINAKIKSKTKQRETDTKIYYLILYLISVSGSLIGI